MPISCAAKLATFASARSSTRGTGASRSIWRSVYLDEDVRIEDRRWRIEDCIHNMIVQFSILHPLSSILGRPHPIHNQCLAGDIGQPHHIADLLEVRAAEQPAG